jgi:hypothetical protein
MMFVIAVPVCLEADYLLSLWLGEYPPKAVTFLFWIVGICLVQLLKAPIVTGMHATGHIFLGNVTAGFVLCSILPVSYVLLKSGYSAESVFVTAFVSMLISNFVEMFVVKRYVTFSILGYLARSYLRCLVVSILSFLLPVYVWYTLTEASYIRLFSVIVTSILSVGGIAFVFGIDSEMRQKLIDVLHARVWSFVVMVRGR